MPLQKNKNLTNHKIELYNNWFDSSWFQRALSGWLFQGKVIKSWRFNLPKSVLHVLEVWFYITPPTHARKYYALIHTSVCFTEVCIWHHDDHKSRNILYGSTQTSVLSRQIAIAEFSLLYIHQYSKVHICGIKKCL